MMSVYLLIGCREEYRNSHIDDLSAQCEIYSQVEQVPTESAAQKRLEDGKVVSFPKKSRQVNSRY